LVRAVSSASIYWGGCGPVDVRPVSVDAALPLTILGQSRRRRWSRLPVAVHSGALGRVRMGGYDPSLMSADLERNKAVVPRFMDEVSDGGDLSLLDELCAPDVANHAARAELRYGIEAFRQLMAIVHASQTERRWTEQHYVAERDLVIVYGVREGTWQASAFRGISTPQKGHVSIELAHMFRVRGGLIHEHWAVRDDLGMLQQLGVLDSP
jgi:predicted ester cyclase